MKEKKIYDFVEEQNEKDFMLYLSECSFFHTVDYNKKFGGLHVFICTYNWSPEHCELVKEMIRNINSADWEDCIEVLTDLEKDGSIYIESGNYPDMVMQSLIGKVKKNYFEDKHGNTSK